MLFKKFLEKKKYIIGKIKHLTDKYSYTKKEAKKKAILHWKAKQTQNKNIK